MTRVDPSEPDPSRWAARLRRHLAWIVALKLVLIALLFALFFSPQHRPDIDAEAVDRRIDSSPR